MNTFFSTFSKLPKSNKSMVYLMWIYFVGVIISTTFVNIYVFQLQQSYLDVLVFNLITFVASAIWFVWMWVLFSILQRNISQMYYIWYVLFILGFLILFIFPYNLIWSYVFWFLYWLATWIYWNAVHSQELKNISDNARDFYSSSISAWSNIISVVIPLIISWLFFLGDKIQFDAYNILFILLPIIYSVSFFFIKNIPVYIPKRVEWKDIFSCLNMKKYPYANMYLLFSWSKHGLAKTAIAVTSILLLKTEINIWVFQWILAFFSSYVVIHFGLRRKAWNRFKFFSIICSAMICLYLLLAWFFNIYTFLFFSVLNLFLFPMYRVSAHTYDLIIMDTVKSWDHDFYPMMLWREILLLISRAWSIILMIMFLMFTDFSDLNILRASLVFVWVSLFWEVVSIYLWGKYEKIT